MTNWNDSPPTAALWSRETVPVTVAPGKIVELNGVGERYSGQDHDAAAEVLGRVDLRLGKLLRDLVTLKTTSHYGFGLLSPAQRRPALRCTTSTPCRPMIPS